MNDKIPRYPVKTVMRYEDVNGVLHAAHGEAERANMRIEVIRSLCGPCGALGGDEETDAEDIVKWMEENRALIAAWLDI